MRKDRLMWTKGYPAVELHGGHMPLGRNPSRGVADEKGVPQLNMKGCRQNGEVNPSFYLSSPRYEFISPPMANGTDFTAVPLHYQILEYSSSKAVYSGIVPPRLPIWIPRLVQASLVVCLFAVLAVGYVEVSYRVLRRHYRNGKLKRYFPLPTNREYTSNLINAFAFISPAVYLYYFYLNPTLRSDTPWLSPHNPMSFKFNPIEALAYLVCYMLMHDTMFYYMHTHAHADKWMYKMTHAMHHEYTHEMNLFTTAYAEAFENFYQTGTPWAIWTAISSHNFWLLNLPLSLNLTTTILGHSGFKAHPYFAHLNPVLYVVQKLFGRHLLTPSDHHAHHSHRRHNYGLYFRWQDKLHGTYIRAKMPSYSVDYWTNIMKGGVYEEHGKSAALGSARPKTKLEYEETSWGF